MERSTLKRSQSAVKNNKQAFEVKITAVPEEVIKADKVILPGVGDFFYCKIAEILLRKS